MGNALNLYRQRFDLEHFFRFAKTKLLVTQYQTPDVVHEETFWNIALLAYAQLFLSRHEGELHLKDWEKYLPNAKAYSSPLTPTQTQRGFQKVLDEIGSPALIARPRGISPGRKSGESIQKREKHEIQIKKKSTHSKPVCKLLGFENTDKSLKPQSLFDAMKTIPTQLEKQGLKLSDFKKAANNLKSTA